MHIGHAGARETDLGSSCLKTSGFGFSCPVHDSASSGSCLERLELSAVVVAAHTHTHIYIYIYIYTCIYIYIYIHIICSWALWTPPASTPSSNLDAVAAELRRR